MAHKSQTVARLQHKYALSPVTALAFHNAEPGQVLLLAGEDTWLKVYDVKTSRLLGQLKIFASQPIHGIYIPPPESDKSHSEPGVLIWGGPSVTLLPPSSLQALISGTTPTAAAPPEFKAPDWLYDGILFPCRRNSPSDPVAGVLVTAHNEILPFSVNANTATTTPTTTTTNLTFGPLASPSRPILYSASLRLLPPSKAADATNNDNDNDDSRDATTVLVAAGTVFGEIIVWKYHHHHYSPGSKQQPQCQVLHVFTGHEGSIFGVSFSDEMELAPDDDDGVGSGGGQQVRARLLVSCSDDRTVRVWDVSEWGDGGGRGGEHGRVDERVLGEARETGFGGGGAANSGSDAGGDSEAGRGSVGDRARCVAVAMGHVSRIWHVRFGAVVRSGASGRGGVVEVYSFGEDSSRQKWELDVDWARWVAEGQAGMLRHRGASTCHSGKNIWSVAVSDSGGVEEPLIATGGADGRIVVAGRIPGRCSFDGYEDLDVTMTIDEVLQSLPPGRHPPSLEVRTTKHAKHTKQTFQRYAFLSDRVMAATASGRLLLATMGDPLLWEELALPEAIASDLRRYNVLKSPARDTALLGSPSGRVYLFRKGHEVCQIAEFPGKISDIVLVNTSPNCTLDEQHSDWHVVVSVLGLDHAFYLHFSGATGTYAQRTVRLPEHYIITAAAFSREVLVLGTRTGSVATFTIEPHTDEYRLQASRRDCKTKDAITSIVPIPGNASALLATCRDGKYRIYHVPAVLSGSARAASLPTLQHEIASPLNTLEVAFFTVPLPDDTTPPSRRIRKGRRDLILQGFHGPHFLSYNATTDAVLARVPCGGAHRPFASVSAPHDPGQTRLVFSKAGELRVVSQAAAAERVLVPGGHGREIRAVAASPSTLSAAECTRRLGNGGGSGGSEAGLVATAAEDTTIRIWRRRASSPRALPSSRAQIPTTTTPSSPPRTTPRPPTSPDAEYLTPLVTLQGHSAGIQTLRWAPTAHGTHLLSSAGSEELFVWRLSRVGGCGSSSGPGSGSGTGRALGQGEDSELVREQEQDMLAVVREAVWDDGTSGGDLRVVDFDVADFSRVTGVDGSQGQATYADSENREEEEGNEYKEGAEEGDGRVVLLISMVLSDSSVRSYVYSSPGSSPTTPPGSSSSSSSSTPTPTTTPPEPSTAGTFTKLASARYTGACPTQVRHLRADGEAVHVLTAFTDGHIAVWTTTTTTTTTAAAAAGGSDEFALALTARLHQSSIKSLDLSCAPGSARWLVSTGGDDNALGFLDLAWDRHTGQYTVLGRYRVRDAHAAAITGLCVVANGEGEEEEEEEEEARGMMKRMMQVASVGNDQRIKLWRVERGGGAGGGLRVAFLDDRYSSVADAGDLELIAPGKLMVGGVGMEVWDVTGDGIEQGS
ncbi:49d5461b-4751-4982-84dc-b6d02c996408 [Thermothielavioides terrestris]|uniref:49d5461b-4751-4982-84dc-b6d02c996408 n=1 Tax=Thermothielavioides terrestris TaxID=2587410 RepID=A0A3S5CVT3_9PEZI|nr:49d5461b-4751-4982-84dc-b6d02c996408 [Thermothielavioides terrestris]